MADKEKEILHEVALQVIEWMLEDWDQSAAYCPLCRFPAIMCEQHEEWRERIHKLAAKVGGLKSVKQGKQRNITKPKGKVKTKIKQKK